MKKNIFVLSTFMLMSGVVLAQTEQEPSLFPELDFGVIQAEVDSDEVSETQAESILQEQQDIQGDVTDEVLEQVTEEESVPEEVSQAETESTPVESDEELPEDEETDEEKEKLIYLALNNIKNYAATIKAVSYCSGYFVLFNDTKKVIQNDKSEWIIHKNRLPVIICEEDFNKVQAVMDSRSERICNIRWVQGEA